MVNFFNILSYGFKVWITSVLSAPALYLIIDSQQHYPYSSSFNEFLSQQIEIYAIIVLIGAALSFFTWLLFLLAISLIVFFCPTTPQTKLLIVLAGLLLSAGTFAVFLPLSFTAYSDFFVLMLANFICIGAGSWLYKLKLANLPVEN